ncbi:glycosyltransferase family 2 protein [Trichococcus shcherbakoviae]|uniref:glycosyltransferase family 2 protein n=1 Tax=Trichococcus shcherbakoviae TaxID=2094020 RepID=UPI0029F46BA0|nr:glycosyltransferase family 2 protein [Trichococcus shcherbakoviae]
MKPTITVFTPTYNRAHLLHMCYESLKNQTIKDFCWLIIDDGSTDETKLLVESWIRESNDFEIKYSFKKNGGLHTGYNLAIEIMDTELCICIDSDDYMPDNAIEKILKLWEKEKDVKFAGIIGLDFNTKNEIIGEPLPDVKDVDLNELMITKKLVGDKKIVMRTELYKKVAPMPTLNNEKNFNPNYMNVLIGEDYRFLVLNENLCFVEYLEEGMTKNIFNQYVDSPNSFAQIRILYMNLKKSSLLFKVKNAIHYTSSCIIAKKYKHIITKSPNKLLTALMFPFGCLLTMYIRYNIHYKR